MALLEVHGLRVLNGVGLAVTEGSVHALIGPNGSGKTTFLNCVSGILAPDGGEVRFRGRRIDGVRPFRRTIAGLGRTFQNIRLFPAMTVVENVLVGEHCRTRAGFLRAWLRTAYLQDVFTLDQLQVVPQYSPMIFFFITLVAGIVCLGWLIWKTTTALSATDRLKNQEGGVSS